MAIGWQEIDGATYFFNGKGQKQTSRWLHLKDSSVNLEGNWYYLNDDSKMQTGGWFKHDDAWYYIQSDGSLLRNGTTPDGYKVNAEGVWTISKSDETTKETKVEHKQDKVTETTQVVTKETDTETNSSVVNEKDQAIEPLSETTEENNQLVLRYYLIFKIKKNTFNGVFLYALLSLARTKSSA